MRWVTKVVWRKFTVGKPSGQPLKLKLILVKIHSVNIQYSSLQAFASSKAPYSKRMANYHDNCKPGVLLNSKL